MALFQSKAAQHGDAPIASQAGTIMAAVYTHSFATTGITTADKLELGPLPAGAQPIRATVIGEGLGAITADIGLMSGTAGEDDATRTVGDEFFDAISVNNNEAVTPVKTCLAISKAYNATTTHRGIGVVFSGNIAAGAGKKITLLLEYVC